MDLKRLITFLENRRSFLHRCMHRIQARLLGAQFRLLLLVLQLQPLVLFLVDYPSLVARTDYGPRVLVLRSSLEVNIFEFV